MVHCCIVVSGILPYKYEKSFHFQFKIEMIDSMYRLAKYRYECGNYVESASYLYFCQLIMSPTDKVSKVFDLSSWW